MTHVKTDILAVLLVCDLAGFYISAAESRDRMNNFAKDLGPLIGDSAGEGKE